MRFVLFLLASALGLALCSAAVAPPAQAAATCGGAGNNCLPGIGDDYPYKNYPMDGGFGYGGYYRECTDFVAWRLNRDGAPGWYAWGNGNQWDDTARSKGVRVDRTPALGAVAQWESNHVAYVAGINADGSQVFIEEYNYGYDGRYNARWIPASSPSNYLHVHDLNPAPPDRDGDGTPNDSDRCPDEAGPVDNGGCPWIQGRVPWVGAVDELGSLRLLHWTGNTWQNDNFSQAVASGSHPRVHLSADNRPFISWVDDGGSLRLSHWTGTVWQHDNFKLGVRPGTSPSAFSGSGGNPFISWVDDGGSLRLSHWTGTVWQHDNFKLGVRPGTSPSAFSGSGGNPFISWVDDGGSLRLSHWAGTVWQHDNFKLGVRPGTSPSAFSGSGGNPFISWVDDGGSLRLSHWTGTVWQHDNFKLGVRPGTSPSAYLGRTDTLWTSWVDNSGALRLSHWTGAAWQHDNLGQGVLAETSPTASLGPNGEPFISWVDASATLWLSHWTGAAWQHDNLGLVVFVPSMMNDSAPAIDGTAKAGSTLLALAGGWTPKDGSYRWEWLVDGRPIDGATGLTYTIGAGDVGKVLSVRVTASKAGYRTMSATSAGLLVAPRSQPPAPPGGGSKVAAPAAVTGIRVRFPTKRVAVLSWSAPANATSYTARMSKKNSFKKWHSWHKYTSPSVRLINLKKGATYRLQIAPQGPGGYGATTTWRFKQRR